MMSCSNFLTISAFFYTSLFLSIFFETVCAGSLSIYATISEQSTLAIEIKSSNRNNNTFGRYIVMSGMMFDSKYNGCVVIHKYSCAM